MGILDTSTNSADWLRYANQGATRNLALSDRLVQSLNFLPEMGLSMEVFSGGQPQKGSGKPRVGSVRHDHGNAADVFFYKDGRKLDWSNEADLPVFQDIVRRAKANGVSGFGAGPNYMQPGSMHIGFGTPAVWGADGKGVNAPDWLREAYGAAPAIRSQTPQPKPDSPTLLGGPSRDTLETTMQPPQQSRGLLFDKLPQAAQDYLTPDRIARTQMALEGMTLRPNQGVMLAAQQTIKDSSNTKRRNKTAEWLEKRGRNDLAEGVRSGAIQGRVAVEAAMRPPPEAKTTDDIQEYQFATANGFGGTFEDWMQSKGGGRAPSAREEQIARMEAIGIPHETAVGIADGVLVVSRDPITGEATVISKANFGNKPAETPTEPTPTVAPQPSPLSSNAEDAFGLEGSAKGIANATMDALGRDVPFPEVQTTQRGFAVLREGLTNDIAGAYGRQPPSWLLKQIQDLTPSAGSTFEGASAAQSKLKALKASLTTEMAGTEAALSRPIAPSDREKTLTRQAGIRSALSRINAAMASFGDAGGNTTSSGIKWKVKQ